MKWKVHHLWKKRFLDVDLDNLPVDFGERNQILCYHPNDRDKFRIVYLQNRSCQLKEHNFPQWQFDMFLCTFNLEWFLKFDKWLEYSVSKDVVFCLSCYLMRYEIWEHRGWDAFLTERFLNWEKKDRLNVHV